MEQKFLIYLLYITIVEIREQAYENNDQRIFGLCDLLHNIPFALTSEDAAKGAYYQLLEDVKQLVVENWLKLRKEEFYTRFPEYKI